MDSKLIFSLRGKEDVQISLALSSYGQNNMDIFIMDEIYFTCIKTKYSGSMQSERAAIDIIHHALESEAGNGFALQYPCSRYFNHWARRQAMIFLHQLHGSVEVIQSIKCRFSPSFSLPL